MRAEDRTEQCHHCKLEVPWGTCNDIGLCMECAWRRGMTLHVVPDLPPDPPVVKDKLDLWADEWTKGDWVMMGMVVFALVFLVWQGLR